MAFISSRFFAHIIERRIAGELTGKHWPRPVAALALACGLMAFGGSPALAQDPPVVSAGSAPGSLSVSWQARDGAIDYDLRYYAGSADPADEADWIEEGEAKGPPDPGTFTSETIAGLSANTAYRVQVRAETADGEGPWSASAGATTASPPAPKIDFVQIVSGPSHDANNRGKYDTYIRGDTILVDVTFNEPVQVGGDGNVVLRLDLGEDDGDPDNSRRTATLQGVRYGDTVLRFAYTVAAGDTDTDGVWVQTGTGGTVLFTPGSATVTGADSGVAAERTKSGLKTAGDPKARVDGGRTSVPGPRPTGAAVNGDTLTVTFDEPLDTSVDTGQMRYDLSVIGVGGIDVNQHPKAVSLSGATLTLTLSHAARAGEETVTLYYGGSLLRDTSGNRTPPFRELAVTNDTPGGPAPTPVRASAVGRELRLVFDRALDESSPPPGDAFVVVNYSQGTGTATVSGKTVTVRLVVAVPATDRLKVNYTRPGEIPPTYRTYPEPGGAPLRGAAADNPEVASFAFWIETVHDGVPPDLLGVEVSQTQGSPARTRAVLSFDEALDTGSVPAAADFTVTLAGADTTVSSIAVEGNAVALTLSAAAAAGSQVTVSYTPGTSPIQDRAGNPSAAFKRTLTAAGSGRPALQSAAVDGDRMTLTYDLPLDPGSAPAPGAFTLHTTPGPGEKAADRRESLYRISAVTVEGRTAVLNLEDPVFPCAGTTPFTVTYAKPAASPLQGLDGTDADGFEHRAVTNDQASECKLAPTPKPPPPPPLTASFESAPAAHDGKSLFSFELVFSENFSGRLDYRVLRDRAFQVGNGRVTGARRAAQWQNRRWIVTVRPSSSADVTVTLPAAADCAAARAVCTEAGRKLSNTVTATVPGPAPPAVAPLTASFAGVPAGHNGRKLFSFELVFSENFPGQLDYRVLRDRAFQVENGRVRGAKRAAQWQNRRWIVTVRPSSHGDVTLTLPAGSVTTQAGRSLSNTVTATVQGPALLSVADAEAREGPEAAVEFTVSLSRAASDEVTVDYMTRNGTATAGEDYTRTRGTLTFAAGERRKTISVPILDDVHDEGRETFSLKLHNARGAAIEDGEATGAIINSDEMPRAWLARFGRAAAEGVVDAIGGRLRGSPATRMTLGGQALDLSADPDSRNALLSGAGPGPAEGGPLLTGANGFARGPNERTGEEAEAPRHELSMPDLLLKSSFHIASADDAGGAGSGRWSVWGRGTRSGFEGAEGALRLKGDVTTARLGLDYERGQWLAGVALSRSSGEGSYEKAGLKGEVESVLTGVYPYARYSVSERLSVWGVVGHGQGDMTLKPQGATSAETDIETSMAAGGARGVLLPTRAAGGFELALRADLLAVETASDAASNLVETQVETSRLRLLIEASRSFRVGAAGALAASAEAGLRYDGGDAETGSGLEVGGSVRWSSGSLTIEVAARGLMAHAEDDYEEWGVSGSV